MLDTIKHLCVESFLEVAVLHAIDEEEEEQSPKLDLGQSWVWSVSGFIVLASAHEGGWPVSSSHWQCYHAPLLYIDDAIEIVVITLQVS